MSARVVIVGSSGQLARALLDQTWPQGLTPVAPGRAALDLAAPGSLDGALGALRPDIVVNAAAYTAVDKAETEVEAALALNRDGPAALANACAARGAALIHVSTDYVFDGTLDRAYREEDPVAPTSVYGRSKAEGEALIRRALERHVILRTSWVFSATGNNFVKTMLRLGEARPEIGVVADQRGRPTAAADLARWIVRVAAAIDEGRGAFGTFHAANAEATTWHGFATAIFDGAARRGARVPERVKAITSADYPSPVKRPANSELATDKLAAAYGLDIPSWRPALAACLDILVGKENAP